MKEASALITGCSQSKIRNYIRFKGAKTLSDLICIFNDTSSGRPTHDTVYGELTLQEIWDRHPHKDNIKKAALSSRISNHGARCDGLWEPLHPNGMNVAKVQRKVCGKCKRRLLLKWFELVKNGGGRRGRYCKKCSVPVKKAIVKKKGRIVDTLTVKYGDTVISKGNLYFVSECIISQKGCKGNVAAFRVMKNGDVLYRTTIYLESNWQKVISL